MKLYTYQGNARAFKALIAAEYCGVSIEVPAFELGKDNKTPEFLAKNPAGKVPVLETAEGCIFESNAIARYVARLRADTNLCGATFFESGQVDAWMDWTTNEVDTPTMMWLLPVLGMMPPNPKAVKQAKDNLATALQQVEAHLATRTFIVGNAVTLADIVLASSLVYPMKFLMDPEYRAAFPNLVRWFRTCVNQPQFRAVVGEVPLAEVETAMPAPAKKEKKEKKKKEQKPKEAKKEKKVEAAPAEAAPAKKAKNPLALLPKSSMVLDEWKRQYSNSEKYYDAMPWFWENLDREGYSLWFCEYNYNADNTVGFMVSNLVTGFLQRCDEVRKYAFGTMAILNEEKPFEVTGCWLLRGQEIKAMLDSNPDAEYYTWTKIENLDDEAAREKVANYWCAAEKLEGKTIFDSKVFK